MILMTIARLEDENARNAMTALYEKCNRLVYHIVKKWIDDPEERMDVAQEVWTNLVRQADLLPTLSEVRQIGYVSYCARNTALNRLDKIKRERRKIIDLEMAVEKGLFMFPDLSVEQIVIQRETIENLRGVLAAMPERDRMLLAGKYLYCESDERLAKWLRCKPSSVRMALTRARRMAIQGLTGGRDREQRPDTTTSGTV